MDNKANLALPSSQPHPIWTHFRAQAAVVPAHSQTATGRPLYYVSRWTEVNEVLRDPDTYSSAIKAEGTGQFMGPTLLTMDGADHTSRRLLLARAFRPAQLDRWERELMAPTIGALCDTVAHQGRAELVGDVLSKFPVHVICAICGIPPKDSPLFLQWALAIHRGMMKPEVGMAASHEMRAYLEPLVEARRAQPGNDLISDIVHAEIDGMRLSDEDIYGFLRLLLPAGSESTFLTMGNALFAMMTIPGLLDRVTADRTLLPAIVEETIRWDVANAMVSRLTTRDTVLGGCPIPKGAALLVFTSSANRDTTQFEHPDLFDPDRKEGRHVGFGTGPHTCLGMHLARIEIRIGLNVVLDRLRNLRLDSDQPPPRIEGYNHRGPNALHVLFDPAT